MVDCNGKSAATLFEATHLFVAWTKLVLFPDQLVLVLLSFYGPGCSSTRSSEESTELMQMKSGIQKGFGFFCAVFSKHFDPPMMEDDEQKIVSWVGRCSRRRSAACGYTDDVKLKAETKATKALHENTCRSYSPINYLNNLRKILYWSIKAENIVLYNTALCLIYLTVSIVMAHSQRHVRRTSHINGLNEMCSRCHGYIFL